MSDNFRGVTFAEQSVTPADDAIVRRAILPDGILTGCEISYSGSTLTMAAGYLIACGRTFQNTTAQNWAVVDATSGYARLVLTIDLTKTATETAFDQIETSIEYAAAVDGFVDLEQTDINLSGTRYQIAACVVSLGTGGITGIAARLEKAEPGAGLNFSVVGGVTQPADPKENMIWVNTDQKITSWLFSATEPGEPAEGMVWFAVGTSSAVEFNALKKNSIQVHPLYARQRVGGAWADKIAKSYQNGEWVDWTLYLFKSGYGEMVPFTSQKDANVTVTVTKDSVAVDYKATANGAGLWQTTNKIDLTNVKEIVFDAKCTAVASSVGSGYIPRFTIISESMVGKWELTYTQYASANLVADSTRKEYILNVSNLSGSYYVAFWGMGDVTIYNVFGR